VAEELERLSCLDAHGGSMHTSSVSVSMWGRVVWPRVFHPHSDRSNLSFVLTSQNTDNFDEAEEYPNHTQTDGEEEKGSGNTRAQKIS